MGRRVIDGPDRSRLLIDVPTGILIDNRSQDITPAIGSVNSPSFTGTHHQPILLIHMSTSTTGLFTNASRAEGSRTLRATRGSGRHRSMLDNVQSRASRRAAARREITPFDFNIGRYQVSPFFRYHVVIARLIFNLRSLGLKRAFRILRPKTYTSGRQKCGPKRGSKTSIGTTS